MHFRFAQGLSLFILLGLGVCRGSEARNWTTVVTKPAKSETISSVVSGKISAILVTEGDEIRKGDVLVELEKRDAELEVRRRKLILESKAELASAKARMETYQRAAEGTRKLYESTQSVSREELQKKELEYQLAKAEWEAQKISEERQQIELEIAREQLDRRSIRSALDGIVTSVESEVGETCRQNEPLMHVVNVDQFHAVANIRPNVSAPLELGQTVALETDRLGGEAIQRQGVISFISPEVDSASGLREVRALFENPDRVIPPGISGKLYLRPPSNK